MPGLIDESCPGYSSARQADPEPTQEPGEVILLLHRGIQLASSSVLYPRRCPVPVCEKDANLQTPGPCKGERLFRRAGHPQKQDQKAFWGRSERRGQALPST